MKTKIVKGKGTGAEYLLCMPDDGEIWYVHKGGTVVNLTYDIQFEDDIIDMNFVSDYDCFTWPDPITTEAELLYAVEY